MKRKQIIAISVIWLIIALPIVQAQAAQQESLTITNVLLTHGPTTLVTWTTNLAANSVVEYGTTTSLGQNATKTNLETAHSIEIQTTPGTQYYYRVTSCETNNCRTTNIDSFTAGPFYVQANIPQYPRSTKIDIPGTTRPGATVTINVNNVDVRKDQIENGQFNFRNIVLVKGPNTIIVKSELSGESAQATYSATVDDQPPEMNITLTPVVTQATTTAKIKVSEEVNLTVEYSKPEGEKPLIPSQLEQVGISGTYAEIQWQEVPEIAEYGIYRDNVMIATVPYGTTIYRDSTVSSSTTYNYKVSALNDKCVESDTSDILTVETGPGNQQGATQEKTFTCLKAKKTQILPAGTTDVRLELNQGENLIDFTAVDKAGLKAYTQERVIYDTGPPKFLEHNLKQLSPSYSQEITVRGKLSEPGSVTAYVNGKPQKTEPTNSDSTFAIKIKLERTGVSVPDITGGQTVNIDTGLAWKSKVKLEAIDAAGLKTSTEETEIEYAICGEGTWFEVKTTDAMPPMLNPRMLIEGIQQIGMSFEYKYRGGNKAVVNPRSIRAKPLRPGPEFQKEYDNNIVQIYTPPSRATRGETTQGTGYIQINFNPITDPWQLIDKDSKAETAPSNSTMFEKEQRISDHRKGECLAPGLGCMKIWLELEIPFQEEIEQTGYLPDVTGGQTKKLENRVQRTCVNIEVAIDQRIPPKYIPTGFLKGVSGFLGSAIEVIDKILKPIETIGKYLFYTCVAGSFLSYVPIFLEKYNCEYSNVLNVVAGEGKFDPKIAEIGACEAEYSKEGQEESKENCMSCQSWKENRKTYERTYKQICDRVYCPSAPSLQYYFQTKGRQKTTTVNAPTAQAGLANYVYGEGLKSGSDCAAWMEANKKTGVAQTKGITPNKYFTTQEINELYEQWLEHKDDEEGDDTGGVNCAGLHPATPECCGYEYMQEWSSACGVSALGNGLDTFDEIKESTCLSAQKVGQNDIPAGDGTTQSCKSVLNSVGGFCSKEGGPTPETIRVVPFQGTSGIEPTGFRADIGIGQSKEAYMYLMMLPTPGATSEWDLKLGYIVETVEFQPSDKNPTTDEQQHFINDKLQGVELVTSSGMQEAYFSQAHKDQFFEGKLPANHYTDFQAYLCNQAGYGNNANCGANGEATFKAVMAKIGTPDQEYVIKPNEGLVNSIRCLCFPTIIGYLKMWKNIMQAVQNCVNTIMLTGDGDSGICQAVISQYACDLIFDALACFTQKWGGPGMGRGSIGTAQAGDVMGALTAAGSEMSKSMDSRYGESSMYKSVFVEKKLVHSVCMWAFTGTWDFDLSATFDQSVDEVPIDSYALLTPCNRRFVAFNPVTRPPGLVTWAYNFGVGFAAGANADVELHLQCSGGYKCQEKDGFENGKCDCDAPRDIVIAPENLPSKVKKGEIMNEQVFYTVQGSPGDGQIRWDKAYLVYRYKDGNKMVEKKTEPCSISLTGGTGTVPAFCRFEPLSFSFRCNYADATGGIHLDTDKIQINYKHNLP